MKISFKYKTLKKGDMSLDTNLATSVRITEYVFLSEITMWGENDNVEYKRDSTEEIFQGRCIRSLKEVQQMTDGFLHVCSSVSPTSFQANLFKLGFKVGVWSFWIQGVQIILCFFQDNLETFQALDGFFHHQ